MLEAEWQWLRNLNAELEAEVANWDPTWGEYKQEVLSKEGQEELNHELNRGDAA